MVDLTDQTSAALAQLLGRLLSTDNDIRSAAETELSQQWMGQQLGLLMCGLADQTLKSDSSTIRSMAAVLFRRIARRMPDGSDDITAKHYQTLDDYTKQRTKHTFLQAFQHEQDDLVRHKISDVLAEIASTTSSSDPWPELLDVLLAAGQSDNANIRESAFRTLASSPRVFIKKHTDDILRIFQQGFHFNNVQVQVGAIVAFAAFFQALPNPQRRTASVLLPELLNVLPPLSNPKEEEHLTTALLALVELAGVAPKMFTPVFRTIIDFGVSVIKDTNLEPGTRQAALELLTTFADVAPNMCKKESAYAENMVVQCLSLMTEVGLDDDDASEWNNEDSPDSDEADSNDVAARQSLDRLALKLGGGVLLQPLFRYLPSMFSSQQWRERHAALMAISSIAEGCRDIMLSELSNVLNMILPLLSDPHPRVRWAACNTVGQMSTDFAPDLEIKYASRVLPPLIATLAAPEPRVQAHAAAACVNFADEATQEILEPYLDSLLTNLLQLLNSPKRYVQEQALTTIAVVADAAETKFVKYYDTMMPILINVLKADTGAEYQLLKAKCIECSSLIGAAVGKEKFAPQAQELMQLYMMIQNSITDPADPCYSYLNQAWGRICDVMGTDFLPYLDGVMPNLVQAAKAKTDLRILESSEDAENFDQKEGWEVLEYMGKHMGLNTSILEEKSTAIKLISNYSSSLGPAFSRYVEDLLLQVVLPGLSLYFHDGVRYASIQAIPNLLKSAKAAAQSQADLAKVAGYWRLSLDYFWEALRSEPLVELVSVTYTSLYECIDLMGPNCFTAEDLDKFIVSSQTVLTEYMLRVQRRLATANDEYAEEEDLEDDEFSDEDLLSELSKTFHIIFKTHRQAFLPAFEKLMPFLKEALQGSNSENKQWALCLIDDMIEFTGPASWKYKDIYLPSLVSSLTDSDANVRQAAYYGIGVAAQYGGPEFAGVVVNALPIIFQTISVPDAKLEEHIHATENAYAAIAKICKTQGPNISNINDQIIPAWVKEMVIVSDEEAAPFAYLYLSELADAGHPGVINQVPIAFDSVAKALEAQTLQGRTAEKVVNSIKRLLSSLPQEQQASLVNSLPVERQNAIRPWFT